MRFNLKNRPNLHAVSFERAEIETISVYEAWFEGFEKELRMKLRNAEKQMKSWQKGSPMWFETAYQHGYFVIKEILGES